MSNSIRSIHRDADKLMIDWDDQHQSVYRYFWLRDNCSCKLCGSHASGSRFQSLLDIPENITPSEVADENGLLKITWANDRHVSAFEYAWLRNNCYKIKEKRRLGQAKTLWDSTLNLLPKIDYRLLKTNDLELYKLFSSVAEYGFVVIRNVGIDPDETLRLAKTVGYIRDTHFGLVGDLILRVNGTHIADFPTQILPHTDETYRSSPIDINIFHCIQPSDDGGGKTILVDSHFCAKELASRFPASFALLAEVAIQHERHISGETIRSHHPVLTIDHDGNVVSVRLNERTMSAIAVEDGKMNAVYEGLRRIFEIAYDEKNWIFLRLEEGEAIIFDNLRVLHGRTAFHSNRHIRQTNVMRDEFYAKKEFLEEYKLGG